MTFKKIEEESLGTITDTVDQSTFELAENSVQNVRERGEDAVREFATKWDGIGDQDSLLVTREDLEKACGRIEPTVLEILTRVKNRIETFAEAQKKTFADCELQIEGGRAGHRWLPLKSAGCYCPGGRYPLPSSVLMTAATARIAGVENVWVASPNPSDVILAAASVAGADGVLRAGGAQAIAAFAFGLESGLPACEVIVGPGNRFVTAAKAVVSRFTRIDSLAGPSELVVVASSDADPARVAADLLAQAEHDPDARPILITFEETFARSVVKQIVTQLETLPTAGVAKQAVSSGGYFVVDDILEAKRVCDQIAPEHLSIQGKSIESRAMDFDSGAALFVGTKTAEVFGDYGAGPNHVLPTGGAARSSSALSVLSFMRFQTTLEITETSNAIKMIDDATVLARIEGLEAHARSSDLRRQPSLTDRSDTN
ncbi:MAG: histidinol dehydrogenase [Planctomycetota bacterium]